MTDRELMQQALDALEEAADHVYCPGDDDAIGVARKALRARLAQPEPEELGEIVPANEEQLKRIAKLVEPDDGYCQACDGNHCTAKNGCVALDNPKAQPEPEPVAWKDAPSKIYLQVCDESDCDQPFDSHIEVSWCHDKINDSDIAYIRADTAPPQREWQGLTDEEMFSLWVKCPAETEDRFAFARAIEQALKEKNT